MISHHQEPRNVDGILLSQARDDGNAVDHFKETVMSREANVLVGEEVVVDMGPPDERRWGWYQFPGIGRLKDGAIHVSYNKKEDSIRAYGKKGGGSFVSLDGGKSWTAYDPLPGDLTEHGFLLPNGDRIRIGLAEAVPASAIDFPKPVGTVMASYDRMFDPSSAYRLCDLPEEFRGFHLLRLPRGEDTWQEELSIFDDPTNLRWAVEGLFHITVCGTFCVLPDQSLLLGMYPGYHLRDDGSIDPKCSVTFYRSTDSARTWRLQGRVSYQPDLTRDPSGDLRAGFSELDYVMLDDGSLFCVMRTTDGTGVAPLYATRSQDFGKTWSKPTVLASNGVEPQLLQLENGALALSTGRPGVQVLVSPDGRGESWSQPYQLVRVEMKNAYEDTCGYTKLLATGPDRFMIVYSHFRHEDEDHAVHKAICVREVRVQLRDSKVETTEQAVPIPDEECTTVEKLYYDKAGGKVACELPILDGKVHGTVRRYYRDGTLADEVPYCLGQACGPHRSYSPNGRLKSETSWKQDQRGIQHKHGPERLYDEHGVLLNEQYYKWWRPVSKQEWEKENGEDRG